MGGMVISLPEMVISINGLSCRVPYKRKGSTMMLHLRAPSRNWKATLNVLVRRKRMGKMLR